MFEEIFNILGGDQADFSYFLGEANVKEEDAFSDANQLTHLLILRIHSTSPYLKMTKISVRNLDLVLLKTTYSSFTLLYIISTRHKWIVCDPVKEPIEYTANIFHCSQNTYRSFHSAVFLYHPSKQ